ncbi:MAG: protoporphyrinogen oxidase [Bdellovibrionota bacterium]
MIGTLDTSNKEVVVVGGGIAGLLAAYYFDQRGYQVTLHEAESRVGGLIATLHTQEGMVERAAHSLFATPAVLDLCRNLGVELTEINPEAKARFILRRKKLRKWPLGIGETLCAFFRAYLVRSKRVNQVWTLEQWALRFLGRPALEYLIVPFLRGIYGAAPSELTVEAAMPSLKIPFGHSLFSFLLAKKIRPSLKSNKPKGKMVAPKFGMEDLVCKLETKLQQRLGSGFQKNSKITSLPASPNVVLAVPAQAASELLKSYAPSLSDKLFKLPYAPLVSVTVFTAEPDFPSPPRGVGVLVPEVEASECLGILFTSSSFSNRIHSGSAHLSLTVMLGGTSRPEILSWTDVKISASVEKEMRAF